MEIEKTFIEGLQLIHTKRFRDPRGSFTKIFNSDVFESFGIEKQYKESYYSISHQNVIRGMHFQIPPHEHSKLVYVNSGRIMDVILDIRLNSPTYGQVLQIEIGATNGIQVEIPIGCAHGFRGLEEGTIVTYMQTSSYSHASDMGIRFDSFGMDWGVINPIISERDLAFPEFNNYKSHF